MTNKSLYLSMVAAAAWLLAGGNAARAAQHDHGTTSAGGAGCCRKAAPQAGKEDNAEAVKKGKASEISLDNGVQVADTTLMAGRYLVQHYETSSGHFMRFMRVATPRPHASGGWEERAQSAQVPCSLERLNAKVRQTAAFTEKQDGVYRMTRIEVKGEDVAHLF